MVRITRNESHYDESSPDIPSGYGIEQHPRDGWYAYRVAEYPGLSIAYLKDAQGLDRVFESREDAVSALHEEELAISDEDVAQVWSDTQVVLPVLMEDAPLHTIDSPYCDDPGCPCHTDEALFQEYIEQPVKSGALKIWDAQALLWPER